MLDHHRLQEQIPSAEAAGASGSIQAHLRRASVANQHFCCPYMLTSTWIAGSRAAWQEFQNQVRLPPAIILDGTDDPG
jgi:predicted aconitase